MKKHSFKNYSSGRKGIFLGGPPNLRKHSFKNYSSGKKRNYIFGRALKPEKAQLPKLYFRKNRNYIFGSVLNVQKNSFKNYSSKRQEKDEEGSETCKSAAPKIVVPKKRTFFWGGAGWGANLQKTNHIWIGLYFLEGSETF